MHECCIRWAMDPNTFCGELQDQRVVGCPLRLAEPLQAPFLRGASEYVGCWASTGLVPGSTMKMVLPHKLAPGPVMFGLGCSEAHGSVQLFKPLDTDL
jgi:hypothetical protein